MSKYIIIWNTEKEEMEFENMQEAEKYANDNTTLEHIWFSITIK